MYNVSTISTLNIDRLKRAMLVWHEDMFTAVILSNHYVCEIQLNAEIDSFPVILYYKKISYAGESTIDLLNIWSATIVDRLFSTERVKNVQSVHEFHMATISKEDLVDIHNNWYDMLIDKIRDYLITTKVVVRLRKDVFVVIEDGNPLFIVDTENTVMLFHDQSDIERSSVHNYRSALGTILCDNSIHIDRTLSIKRGHKKLAKEILKEFSLKYGSNLNT